MRRRHHSRLPAVVALTLGLTAAAGVGEAADFSLQGDYWGNTTAPNGWFSGGQYGLLPGINDDAFARTLCDSPLVPPCGDVYLADVNTKQPITASVRSFDGAGRRLHIDDGGALTTQNDSQASGLTLRGGQLSTFSVFTVRTMTVEDNGAGNPSIITTPNSARFEIQRDAFVRGTVDFRSVNGEVRNLGTMTQTGVGNISLWFGQDFRNGTGGVVDIQNDNGIAVRSPAFDVAGPTPIRFLNDAGATLTKSAGSGTSVIEAPIVNAGKVSASSGQLTLAGGGTHGTGASLEATGDGILGLQGAHTVTGAVTSSGDGRIYLGEFGKPGTMTIAGGGTLTNGGRFFQSGALTVQSAGKLEQTGNGALYAFSDVNVAAGGRVDNAGLIQLEGAFANRGDVTVKAGAAILGIGGTGSYTQQAGSTVIESAGSFALANGQYRQDGGSTDIKAGGTLELRACDAATGECSGGAYLQSAGTTKVNGSLAAAAVRFEGGELNGSGSILGDVSFALGAVDAFSGTIAPGNSPGQLTIEGNLLATSAVFNIEIGGYLAGTDFDRIFVTGNATIDGGLLNFLFIDDFLPQVGDSFSWLTAGGLLEFINMPDLTVSSSRGTVFGILGADGSFLVTNVEVPGGPPIVSAPEPGSLALLGLALAGLALARRRRAS